MFTCVNNFKLSNKIFSYFCIADKKDSGKNGRNNTKPASSFVPKTDYYFKDSKNYLKDKKEKERIDVSSYCYFPSYVALFLQIVFEIFLP